MLQKNSSGSDRLANDILMQSKKVLIVKGPGIGDVITLIPLAKNFKKILNCEVHVLEEIPPEKEGTIILKKCPYVDKIMRIYSRIEWLDPAWGEMRREILTLQFIPDTYRFIRDIIKLRKEKYDIIFDGFPGTKYTHIITKILGAKHRICCSSHPYHGDYDIVNSIKAKNIIMAENEIFSLVSKKINYDPEIFFNKKDLNATSKKLLKKYGITDNDKLIGITTGQGYKKWQNSKWVELIRSLKGSKIILLGNSDQAEDAKEIEASVDTINLVNKLTLEESISIISNLNMFLCTNGGLMWISSALGVPTIVVSGPTPYWWDPRVENCIVVRRAGEEFYNQKEYSPKQDAKTEDVSVDDVIIALKKLHTRPARGK